MHKILEEPDLDLYADIQNGITVYQVTSKGREPISNGWGDDVGFLCSYYGISVRDVIPYLVPMYAVFNIQKMEVHGFYSNIGRIVKDVPEFIRGDEGNVSRVISGQNMQHKGYVIARLDPCESYEQAHRHMMTKIQDNIVFYLMYKAYKDRKQLTRDEKDTIIDVLR